MVVKEIEFAGGATGIVDVATGEVIAETEEPSGEVGESRDAAKLREEETALLMEGLKRIGGTMLHGQKCPECGNQVALAPGEGDLYEVCVGQFREDPSCYWKLKRPKEKKK